MVAVENASQEHKLKLTTRITPNRSMYNGYAESITRNSIEIKYGAEVRYGSKMKSVTFLWDGNAVEGSVAARLFNSRKHERRSEKMPIRPENKDRYPPDWPDIRNLILGRAGNCCETCGVRNHAVGYRDPSGEFIETPAYEADPDYWDGKWDVKIVKIVLTVMHLDHTPENCDPANLKAACQLCHNQYDAPVRAAGKKRRRRARIAQSQAALKLNTQGVSGDSD